MSNALSNLLNDFISMAENRDTNTGMWREQPVDLVTFFKDPKFLGEKPYPGKQTEILEVVNQILWFKLTGNEKLCIEDLRHITECVFMLGKGCKHGSTKITDAETGKVYTIEELFIQQKEIDVTCLDEDTQKLTVSRASAPVKYGEGESFLVTTKSGHETVVYGEHVFLSRKYVAKNKKGLYRGTEWKKIREIGRAHV